MNILLIEDDEIKSHNINKFLNSIYNDIAIHTRGSVKSGLEFLKTTNFDLLLLDMTLPTFDISSTEDGGRPQPYGGREILRQMERLDLMTPAIVITGFDKFGEGQDSLSLDELNLQLSQEHRNYKGAVYYSSFDDSWMSSLELIINKLD
ncbi:response regulator [Salidesulfovibrio brasiliensis]|uniref:response regulator n=1 Tax=Salidesulfovibrio brasiliensis TaxID=221711 RepID=UPI0009F85886|nr:response regulator [Salidesulfovibrio brasiliensis]